MTEDSTPSHTTSASSWPLRVGTYELAVPIGAGGVGMVFRGRAFLPTGDTEPCAIKVLHSRLYRDEAMVRRFRREATIGYRLTHQHPALATIRDIVRAPERLGGGLMIVMELVDGWSVSELLPRFAERDDAICAVARNALSVLRFLHEHGVVHGDISNSNLMVTRDGQLRLIDLGLARQVDEPHSPGVRGTAAYVSPEMIRGDGLCAESDLYSLGAVLYELVTGAPPYGRGEMYQVWQRILQERIAELPARVAPQLVQLIVGLLHREPTARLPIAEALAILGPERADSEQAALRALARDFAQSQQTAPRRDHLARPRRPASRAESGSRGTQSARLSLKRPALLSNASGSSRRGRPPAAAVQREAVDPAAPAEPLLDDLRDVIDRAAPGLLSALQRRGATGLRGSAARPALLGALLGCLLTAAVAAGLAGLDDEAPQPAIDELQLVALPTVQFGPA
ncbi:MAG: serine/threonine-protein kinase, partial [Myxococcota bacterium]